MTAPRTQVGILRFWAPLAATWLMMAAEGPFLAAVIARLGDPAFNLAAYGVAFAFALLVESPVIMMMSASTALVDGTDSFRRLRRFAHGLSAAMTAVMLLLLLPPVFRAVMEGLVALPHEVARRTHLALLILLPWPGAIGYRRFYQGLLIRDGRTRLVAYGTVVRLATMATTATVLYVVGELPGAAVGAAALSAGVVLEALATRVMARPAVLRLTPSPDAGRALSYGRIARFYYPLALTSLIGLVLQPMLTFFMGRAPAPVESLAVFPVIHALSFVFRALGLSYQEVVIVRSGRRFEAFAPVRRFAVGLGLAASAGLAAIAATPLAGVWFGTVSGLSPVLVQFAILPAVILIPLPALTVLQSVQRGVLVNVRRTAPVTWATALEIGVVAVAFPVLTAVFGWTGVVSACAAFLAGRLAAVAFLAGPAARAIREVGACDEP
jgi:progressive ankylosis protein